MRVRSLLLPALFLAALGAFPAQAATVPLVLSGQLTFFNDSGTFLIDLGGMSVGKTLGGKLSNVVTRDGAGAFVKKSIPAGALVTFTVLKKGAYPEGTIRYAGHDLGEWLVSKNLATLVGKTP
ncbi:hypothetical protein Q0M94_15360 [Deinococcus radiomollis]|uniref:hypothetical protein n=1 Tax=Deinococcus radiomollis TaxID=468916 RepID=UPI00389289BE